LHGWRTQQTRTAQPTSCHACSVCRLQAQLPAGTPD
jgi:hypothetical protein